MKNANELRKELASVFYDLRHRKIDVKQAAELANIAGKMISSAKAQLEYAFVTKQAQKLPFLEEPPAEGGACSDD